MSTSETVRPQATRPDGEDKPTSEALARHVTAHRQRSLATLGHVWVPVTVGCVIGCLGTLDLLAVAHLVS